MNEPVVAVALSGGVDSLVSGYLLKERFRSVFGIHFTTGYEAHPVETEQLEKQLGFPVKVVDLSLQFEEKVIRYFVRTYLNGRTPNPCMVCNRDIKFGVLMDIACKMGADILSTGHYVTVVNSISSPEKQIDSSWLEKGRDPLKDQSYFLSLVPGERLDKTYFPLAGMNKKNVKNLAREKGLTPLHESESQDICFIHDNNFSAFIRDKEHLDPLPGDIVDPDGRVVGKHDGLHRFTVGQRRGINCPASEPYYVKQIDMQNNRLVVCFKKDLTCSRFETGPVNWNYLDLPPIENMTVKIRYSHREAAASLTLHDNGGTVIFETPQNAVTPGQGAVFYKGSRLLGAGMIA